MITALPALVATLSTAAVTPTGLAESGDIASKLPLLQAISQVESGDNDKAMGRYGEVSRYQILPRVWGKYSYTPLHYAIDIKISSIVAYDIARDIIDQWQLRNGETTPMPPRYFYAIWHRGKRFWDTRGGNFDNLPSLVKARCYRFENVYNKLIKDNHEKQSKTKSKEVGAGPGPGTGTGKTKTRSRAGSK